MDQTIKVEVTVYVGMEKYSIEDTTVWSPEDDLNADELAAAILDHCSTKMAAALNPCFYIHDCVPITESDES
jgi:hypothetical protein